MEDDDIIIKAQELDEVKVIERSRAPSPLQRCHVEAMSWSGPPRGGWDTKSPRGKSPSHHLVRRWMFRDPGVSGGTTLEGRFRGREQERLRRITVAPANSSQDEIRERAGETPKQKERRPKQAELDDSDIILRSETCTKHT